ncbi:MAG: IS1182 family transposase [SAR202 cluster bacterium]|jgi:transposase|nr:IS5/IS1182 family transposase [Rhodospirillaceae bacterium]MQG68338.1 IS1182 family transposase [SAR202 cluster bacterium]|tara:strand:+ start:175 stop:1533 length:1359 start_codon:yes stop_codon:yes gene_type:complete
MMGQAVGQQDRLFYEFNLEDRVPSNHLLRRIDAVLDLSWLRAELSPFYSHTGCPSIDPELMIRMLLVGYCHSIRSERRLCQEVELNLAYRWFCRLGLEDKVPDHSTFSVNRHGRFRDSDILRSVFESVVRRCMESGLVGGEGFAVDASVIEADASRFARVEGAEIDWSEEQLSRRAIKEYVDALESENAPINPDRKPKAISPSDPAAAWTTRGRYKVMFGYSLNYLMDMKNAVIVDVEATPTRISKEVEATETMIERTQERFALKPRHIAGDVAYGTGKMLGWLGQQRIEPHIPVWDKGARDDGTLSRGDFAFDKDGDVYVCPQGKALKTTGRVHDGKTLLYRSSKHDCDPCPLKPKCCPRAPSRKIPRDINEAARDHARSLNGGEAYNQSARDRKKIERLFGEAKRNLAFTRLRLRGLSGAKDEFLLMATAQNLRRLVKLVSRPPPRSVMA